MGRGDKRTVKGKRTKGSFGVCRLARPLRAAKAKNKKENA